MSSRNVDYKHVWQLYCFLADTRLSGSHLRLSIGFNNVYEISVYTKCRELPFQSVYPIDVGGRGQLVIGRLWDLQRFKVRANY